MSSYGCTAETPTPQIRVEELLADIKMKVDRLAVTEEDLQQWGAFVDADDRDEWRRLDGAREELVRMLQTAGVKLALGSDR